MNDWRLTLHISSQFNKIKRLYFQRQIELEATGHLIFQQNLKTERKMEEW